MIKRSDDIEIHTVKPFKPPPEYVTCPLCKRNVQSQAIGGHLSLKHGIKGVSLDSLKTMTLRGTAKKILGDLEIESKKKVLDEALYTAESGPEKEAESVSPDGPPEPAEVNPEETDNPENQVERPKKKMKRVGLWPWARWVEVDDDE